MSTHSGVYALHGLKYGEQILHTGGDQSTYYGPQMQAGSPVMLHAPYVERRCPPSPATSLSGFHGHNGLRQGSPSTESSAARFNPYPRPLSAVARPSPVAQHLDAIQLAPPIRPQPSDGASRAGIIMLPPIIPPNKRTGKECHLPPISALDDMHGRHWDDSRAVLERLKLEDSDNAMAVDSVHGPRSISRQRLREL